MVMVLYYVYYSPSPNNENLLITSLSSVSVSVHMVRFQPPVTSFHWSRDRPSLGVATGFDQKIKIMIVTNISKYWEGILHILFK